MKVKKVEASKWADLMVGVEDKEIKDKLWFIYMDCKKINTSLETAKSEIRKGSRDYSVFMDVMDRFKYVFNVYKDLVGNIVYSSGDDKAIENFDKDMSSINQRIDLEGAMDSKKQPDKNVLLILIYNEIVSVLQYFHITLNNCDRKNFRESLVDVIRLMGGKLEKKEVFPPQPTEGLTQVSGGSEEKEEEVEEDEGLEEWKKIAEKLEGKSGENVGEAEEEGGET